MAVKRLAKLWKRKIEVKTNGLSITNKMLHIEFEVPFDDDHLPNSAIIKIYNLVHDTREKIKEGERLTLNAGYEGDVGQILSGKITAVWSDKVGQDRATRIRVVDEQGTKSKKKVEKSYKKAVKSSTIIRDVANAIGMKIKVLELPNDKLHKKGYSCNGKGVDTIKSLAEDCGASFYPILGQWYIRDIRKGDNINFELSPSTGLLGVPERFTKKYQKKSTRGFKIEALLQHRVKTAAILKLHSKTVTGTFRVIGGKHIATKDDFQTHLEVVS